MRWEKQFITGRPSPVTSLLIVVMSPHFSDPTLLFLILVLQELMHLKESVFFVLMKKTVVSYLIALLIHVTKWKSSQIAQWTRQK